MELALAIAQLLNTAAPGIAQLIVMIRNTNGTVSIMPILDAADKQFDANIQQATDWLKSHGKAVT